jgi:hypothetical protein
MAGIFFTWSTMRLIDHPNVDTAYAFVGSLAVLACALMLRVSALKVQDRVIRLEERLRFARILPADLQARIEELRPSHLVALRFASDAEVADLVRKVLANPQMSQKDIKLLVRDWRADYFRA